MLLRREPARHTLVGFPLEDSRPTAFSSYSRSGMGILKNMCTYPQWLQIALSADWLSQSRSKKAMPGGVLQLDHAG